jgi:hypothetical protein
MIPEHRIDLPANYEDMLYKQRSDAANEYASALLNIGLVVPSNSPIHGERTLGECAVWLGITEDLVRKAREAFLFLSERGKTFAEYQVAKMRKYLPEISEPADAVEELLKFLYDTVYFQRMDPGGNGDILLKLVDYKLKEYNAKRNQGFGIAS